MVVGPHSGIDTWALVPLAAAFQGILPHLTRLQRLFGLGVLAAVNSFEALPSDEWMIML